ncbi:MAG TPA: helix-turn-helix transcriptional regulator [Polyangiaceae bacterium]
MRSSSTSLRRGGARRALLEVCRNARTACDFGRDLRASLHAILPFDSYCLNLCDPQTGVIARSIGDGLDPEQARRLFALEARGEEPNSLRELFAGPKRVASLWLATGGNPGTCERMREIFTPLGFVDELRAALVVAGSCYGYLHLFRSGQLGPFSEVDVHRVKRAAPDIARALRTLPAESRGRAVEADSLPELLLLDDRWHVVGGSVGASARLGQPDTLAVSSGLAHAVQDVASRAERGERARVTIRGSNGAPLGVAAVPLGTLTAIVLDSPPPPRSPAENAALFALTPRECEIAELVADGYSNRNIALALEISVHTVKDHLKALLAKTRSGSRTELAARLRGAG